jgi:hypothetical protein
VKVGIRSADERNLWVQDIIRIEMAAGESFSSLRKMSVKKDLFSAAR